MLLLNKNDLHTDETTVHIRCACMCRHKQEADLATTLQLVAKLQIQVHLFVTCAKFETMAAEWLYSLRNP